MTFEEYKAKYDRHSTFEKYKERLANYIAKYNPSEEMLKQLWKRDREYEEERLKEHYEKEEKRMAPAPFTVPTGEYWLGDPCYSFSSNDGRKYPEGVDPDKIWRDELFDEGDFYNPIQTCSLGTIYSFFTQYGDGGYRDNFGNSFCVDAGMIGLVPVGMMPPPRADLAIKVVFTEPTLCHRTREGVLTFGSHIIETNWDNMTDEEEDVTG